MIEVSVDELRANLKDCLQQVEEGEVLVIRRRGKTIARIVPARENIQTQQGSDSREVTISWGGKALSPWKPVAVNRGPELVSDLVRGERDSTDD